MEQVENDITLVREVMETFIQMIQRDHLNPNPKNFRQKMEMKALLSVHEVLQAINLQIKAPTG
jgi:hypothetical protein